jgi:hypothetical protein
LVMKIAGVEEDAIKVEDHRLDLHRSILLGQYREGTGIFGGPDPLHVAG